MHPLLCLYLPCIAAAAVLASLSSVPRANTNLEQLSSPQPQVQVPIGHYKLPPNVAVIVEESLSQKLVPLLLSFSEILGPKWPIILFTPQPRASIPNSADLGEAIREHRIAIRDLPSGVHFSSDLGRSEFLTQPWLWVQLAPAQHVLLFQIDTILCPGSRGRIEAFLEYDFADAVLGSHKGGEGRKGGLSLRNRGMMEGVAERCNWHLEMATMDYNYNREANVVVEDQWFYRKLEEIPEAKLPSAEVMGKFKEMLC